MILLWEHDPFDKALHDYEALLMAELKEGDRVFDAKGMPVGVVIRLNDDELVVARHGTVFVGPLPTKIKK